MNAIYVRVTRTRGSAPRDAGTAMRVTATDCTGTIGGGALEYRAIATARRLLAAGQTDHTETIPLGPGLGQCCGGAVSLHYGVDVAQTDEPAFAPHVLAPDHTICPLWIWGAGHVGRAVIKSCPAQAFDITWIDSAPERFPDTTPDHVTQMPTLNMPRLGANAPSDAWHLVFTYSHDIDLALCAALLRRGAAGIGLIGSETKRVRFSKRLRAMGLDPSAITCPIGDKTLGKAPHQIAHGTVNALLNATRTKVSA
ncbi:xanthine dehydrogenase accessory protein XdhC [Sulfitobacter sp. F26169L]|uniref:xanthine dehydrogenase accessory protein XdhC n=1 Tax=Sulfitobacter sp. F26169L TaxID=2996015 RepID=UPI002260C1B8|nr:xanthine dehydrogenase accessory protein XdhC [Sulfitobacter sp. F26169L]MCX7567342.1 xanthine dehydrogenase accessory protein XdhC [Sulfitobacter sp. F26169L]